MHYWSKYSTRSLMSVHIYIKCLATSVIDQELGIGSGTVSMRSCISMSMVVSQWSWSESVRSETYHVHRCTRKIPRLFRRRRHIAVNSNVWRWWIVFGLFRGTQGHCLLCPWRDKVDSLQVLLNEGEEQDDLLLSNRWHWVVSNWELERQQVQCRW